MSEKNYMTPQGHSALTSERDHLLKVERPEVTKVVAWAAGNGDRSENADYTYGKKRLREIDKRLRFLGKKLDAAVVVKPIDIKSDKVQFGATVTVSDESGEERTYCIVGVDETNLEKGHISWRSPIGSALLGKKVGDSATAMTPTGEKELDVLRIEYKELA